MSHPTAWTCRSCRVVLGQVRAGVLRPSGRVASVDGRGVARVPCPSCGRVRVWFPAYPPIDPRDPTGRSNDGDRCAREAMACRNA